MTEAQRLTVATLAEHYSYYQHAKQPIQYPDGTVRLIIADDSPAPNPVRCVWSPEGECIEVWNEQSHIDAHRAIGGARSIVEREDDLVFLIAPGGTYCPATGHCTVRAR